MTLQKSDILAATSRCASELGEQRINDFRLARNAIRLSPIEIIGAHCLGAGVRDKKRTLLNREYDAKAVPNGAEFGGTNRVPATGHTRSASNHGRHESLGFVCKKGTPTEGS
jgi:hypothetical protein